MTIAGPNTYLLGTRGIAVIDPGPASAVPSAGDPYAIWGPPDTSAISL